MGFFKNIFKKKSKVVEHLHVGSFYNNDSFYRVIIFKEDKLYSEPHMHIISVDNPGEEYCVSLIKNKYYFHGKNLFQTMDESLRKSFGYWLVQPNNNSVRGYNNWAMGLLYWVGLNRLAPNMDIPNVLPTYYDEIKSPY